jgi:hypothetical protein
MPLLNTLGMKVGSEETFGAGYNVLPIWKKRLDAKTLITTPNSDVIYAMSYVDVGKDGPLVFEAPPQMQGILLDFWQRPIPVDGGEYFGDVGIFGPDQAKGGKFLILPPGYKDPVPEGYYIYRSGTNNVFVFLRAFYKDPNDLAPPVDLLQQAKIYPLSNKAEAKAMAFPDGSGVSANMLPRNDASAFDQLKSFVDGEPSSFASPSWVGMLAGIGIVKGNPFQPDAKTRAILDAAARTAYKMSRAIGSQSNASGRSFLIWPNRHWLNPMADGTPENLPGGFSMDYYSLSPGMISQTAGKGAKYAIAFVDNDNNALSGDSNYRVHLPANVPAANFWSITLYEAENASGLANAQRFPSLGSRDKPAQNSDGSTDIYFGQKAPAGKEANWMATPAGKGYFVILRFYGPTQAAIDKSWVPGDIEKLK